MKKKRTFLFQSAFALAYRVFSAGLSYGLFLAIPLLFGVEALGIFVLFQTLLGALGAFLTLGLNIALLRYVAQEDFNSQTAQLYHKSMALSIGFSLLVALLVFLFSTPLSQLFPAFSQYPFVMVLLAISLPFQSMLLINVEVIRGMHIIKVSEFFRNLLAYLVAILALAFGYFLNKEGVLIAVWAFTIGTVLAAVMSTLYVVYKTRGTKRSSEASSFGEVGIREMLRTSLPMMGSSLVQNWNSRIMTVMLGFLASVEVVGVFGLSYKLSTLPDFFTAAIKAPSAPLISRYFKNKDWGELQKLLQTSVRLIVLLIIPVGAVLFIFSDALLSFTDKSFTQGTSTLRILIVATVSSSFFGLTGAFLNMCNHQTLLFKVVLFAFLLNLSISWLMVPQYGADGAAMAFLISTITWNALSAFFIYRKYSFTTFPYPIKSLRTLNA